MSTFNDRRHPKKSFQIELIMNLEKVLEIENINHSRLSWSHVVHTECQGSYSNKSILAFNQEVLDQLGLTLPNDLNSWGANTMIKINLGSLNLDSPDKASIHDLVILGMQENNRRYLDKSSREYVDNSAYSVTMASPQYARCFLHKGTFDLGDVDPFIIGLYPPQYKLNLDLTETEYCQLREVAGPNTVMRINEMAVGYFPIEMPDATMAVLMEMGQTNIEPSPELIERMKKQPHLLIKLHE